MCLEIAAFGVWAALAGVTWRGAAEAPIAASDAPSLTLPRLRGREGDCDGDVGDGDVTPSQRHAVTPSRRHSGTPSPAGGRAAPLSGAERTRRWRAKRAAALGLAGTCGARNAARLEACDGRG